MKNKIVDLGISKREAEELINVSKNIEKDYKKLLRGYPIQYLIGYSNFYGYKFLINKNVLIPRYETETLVEKTINYIHKYIPQLKHIIDLGTGSGCIAITLQKEFTDSFVEGVDISCKALKVAKGNNKINNTSVKFYRHNILKELKGKYDVIISNPPYINSKKSVMEIVHKYEPHKALYAKEKGLEFYKKIIENSVNHVNTKNILAFEIGEDEGSSIVKISKKYYPKSKILLEKDLSGKNRYIFIINE